MIGLKVNPEFKELLQKLAAEENRSLSNFIKNCLMEYLKENRGIDWKQDEIVQVKPESHETLTFASSPPLTVHEPAKPYGKKKKE